VTGGVARGKCDLGRASERFESERHQRSERLRPGPRARRLSVGRPATAVTAGTAPVTASTATDHGCHGAGHGIHSAGHSDPGDGGRTASPGSAAAAAVAAAASPSHHKAERSNPPTLKLWSEHWHEACSSTGWARLSNARGSASQMTPAWERVERERSSSTATSPCRKAVACSHCEQQERFCQAALLIHDARSESLLQGLQLVVAPTFCNHRCKAPLALPAEVHCHDRQALRAAHLNRHRRTHTCAS
jgi:hypothetical protein